MVPGENEQKGEAEIRGKRAERKMVPGENEQKGGIMKDEGRGRMRTELRKR